MPQRRTFAESQIEGDYEGAPFAPDLHDARHLWLKAVLLLVWLLVSFVACYFARDLPVTVGGSDGSATSRVTGRSPRRTGYPGPEVNRSRARPW